MKRVLITDDEKNIRLTISRALENLGNIEIETALNGEDAIQKLNNSSFDLLLLDIKMPGMSGLDVIDVITGKNIMSVLTNRRPKYFWPLESPLILSSII